LLFLNKLYTAVLGTTGIGLVISYGFVTAFAYGTEVELVAT
jgi:hypothetical protein